MLRKHGVSWQIWLNEIYKSILLIFQNTTMRVFALWIKDLDLKVYVKKTHSISDNLL